MWRTDRPPGEIMHANGFVSTIGTQMFFVWRKPQITEWQSRVLGVRWRYALV